jgi:hypothetical protein
MNPYVKSVQAQDGYLLLLEFENGERRSFDLKPYLKKGVFMRLQNVALFKTARVTSGSVEWAGEIDLSYDTLYLESKPIAAKKIPAKRKLKAAMKINSRSGKRGIHKRQNA